MKSSILPDKVLHYNVGRGIQRCSVYLSPRKVSRRVSHNMRRLSVFGSTKVCTGYHFHTSWCTHSSLLNATFKWKKSTFLLRLTSSNLDSCILYPRSQPRLMNGSLQEAFLTRLRNTICFKEQDKKNTYSGVQLRVTQFFCDLGLAMAEQA